MPATLLTGATGTLGRALRPLLEVAGHDGRILGRKERPVGEERGTWRRGDLFTGRGLDSAFEGANVIVHCASGRRDLKIGRASCREGVQRSVLGGGASSKSDTHV